MLLKKGNSEGGLSVKLLQQEKPVTMTDSNFM